MAAPKSDLDEQWLQKLPGAIVHKSIQAFLKPSERTSLLLWELMAKEREPQE